MQLESLLPLSRVSSDLDVSSKKRALQSLSQLLADNATGLDEGDIFDSFLARERLGTTGLGKGVAIPHGRMASAKEAYAAVLKLDKGVEYDAPDDAPVDLLIGLVVPEDSTDEHLQILAGFAEILGNQRSLDQLRNASDLETLYKTISNSKLFQDDQE
ncbi:unnamed protein product [Cyprideis torosa]|uniref:Uncharacterized protein n=1 Tax=Cyprideis torosa TaxID=163714 RepID=A0A7R8ZXZ3_9CRUS|nr:unnamed protein product [Cyprideis torosa]CAG0907584.1 unnamed protein product [Cyprideis torosa]